MAYFYLHFPSYILLKSVYYSSRDNFIEILFSFLGFFFFFAFICNLWPPHPILCILTEFSPFISVFPTFVLPYRFISLQTSFSFYDLLLSSFCPLINSPKTRVLSSYVFYYRYYLSFRTIIPGIFNISSSFPCHNCFHICKKCNDTPTFLHFFLSCNVSCDFFPQFYLLPAIFFF